MGELPRLLHGWQGNLQWRFGYEDLKVGSARGRSASCKRMFSLDSFNAM
jgi:hypothetical protein